MSTSGSSKAPLVTSQWSKIADPDKGRVVCVEFKQAKEPFNWRKYMCDKCGALRGKHCVCKAKAKVDNDIGIKDGALRGKYRVCKAKAKAGDDTGIKEEYLPPRKRLMLGYKREKKALAAASASKQARDPFNRRKYMSDKCGALRGKHCICKAKAKADDDMGMKEVHLPPRKRLMLSYMKEQKALAATASAAREKGVCEAKAMADDDTGIKEEDLPPRKRLLLRYEREQKALAATASVARQKGICKAKAKADDDMGIKEVHLPPRKRLLLRYEREQKALAATASTAREKGKEDGQLELEEGEITWIPGAMTTKGNRAPRRRRA